MDSSGQGDRHGDDSDGAGFELVSRVGALPVLNHFLARTGLPALLERYLPGDDGRYRLAPATAVGLVVTNLALGRQPLYGLGEWAARFDPALLGLAPGEIAALNDDRVGRALERLFDADRASLLTELLLGVVDEFGIDTAELHNDSSAPRGALLYPLLRREGFGGISLGLMAYLDPKGCRRENSMPGNQWPCQAYGVVCWEGPRDMAKAGLPEPQSPGGVKLSPAGKTPETGAGSAVALLSGHRILRDAGAISSEDIEGDEWGAYVTLLSTTGTNAGSPTGREPYGDTAPVVVVGVTTGQGDGNTDSQGKGAQVTGHQQAERCARCVTPRRY
jgi:hypothetical protein